MASFVLSHDAQDIDDTIDEVQAARGSEASLSARLSEIVSAMELAVSTLETAIAGKITLADVFGSGALIPDNADLNDFTTGGKYYGGNTAGNTVSNLPVANGAFTFSLEVKQATPSMTYQYLRVCRNADDPYIYVRRKYNSWGSWYRFTGEAVAAVSQSAPASLMQAGRIDAAEPAAAEPEEEADA